MLQNGLLILLAIFSPRIIKSNAQTSNVTQCVTDYSWSINSLGQTPCLVAAYLESECSTQPFQVNSLPEGNHYTGPSFAAATPCICSSVTYSLISACGGCQGRNFTDWNTWKLNCSTILLTTFPKAISSGTNVPEWAYLNLTLTNNTFDPLVAQANASSASAQTSSQIISSTTDSSATGAPTSDPTPIAAAKSNHSNAGAIAGGVVGGLAFIATVTILTLWLLARRRNSKAMYVRELGTGSSAPPLMREAPSMRDGPSPMSDPTSYTYDSPESNPYPLSPATSGFYTTGPASRRSMDSATNTQYGSQAPRGAYTGAAEI